MSIINERDIDDRDDDDDGNKHGAIIVRINGWWLDINDV